MSKYEIVGDARGMGLIGCIEGAAAPGMSGPSRLAIDAEFGARVDAKCEAIGRIVRPMINMCGGLN